MCIFVFIIFYKSHFLSQVYFDSSFDLHNFFLTSSLSFFSKRYVSYTRSKDEIVRNWGTFGQVFIFFFIFFFFIIIIIIIIIIHFISSFGSKIKCCREIITTTVIVFIFKYTLIWFSVFTYFIFKSSIYTPLNSMMEFILKTMPWVKHVNSSSQKKGLIVYMKRMW